MLLRSGLEKGKIVHKNAKNSIRLYVFRYKQYDNEWKLENSQPCMDCMKLIVQVKVTHIFFSLNDEKLGRGVMKMFAEDYKTNHISLGRKRLKGLLEN
jgi:deoxycytidylate deaminase